MVNSEIHRFMQRAFDLSTRAEGKTYPNPAVGAVVVKNGRIVGEGYHKRAGQSHAEVMALKAAGPLAKGALLFCTLEPCCHVGRTGPCTEKIIQSGIKAVYVGIKDPNPVVCGRGIARLKKAGVRVTVGFLSEQICDLNRPFVTAMTKHRPMVTVKIAESLDGKIATSDGSSKWITSSQSRARAHKDRRFFDAILVGINTVLSDDPFLELPGFLAGHQQLTKVIVDTYLRLPRRARLLRTRQPVIIACGSASVSQRKYFAAKNVLLIETGLRDGRVDLMEMLSVLHRMEIRSVLVEGGGRLIGSFLDRRLADRVMVYLAPIILGGEKAVSAIGGHGVGRISEAIRLRKSCLEKIGPDLLITGDLIYS